MSHGNRNRLVAAMPRYVSSAFLSVLCGKRAASSARKAQMFCTKSLKPQPFLPCQYTINPALFVAAGRVECG